MRSMTFIVVHGHGDGVGMYVNVQSIRAFGPLVNPKGSWINTGHSDGDLWVKQTPEEIIALMEENNV